LTCWSVEVTPKSSPVALRRGSCQKALALGQFATISRKKFMTFLEKNVAKSGEYD
jgi:hypothetical protein